MGGFCVRVGECGCLFARISKGLHNPLIFMLTADFTDANIHVSSLLSIHLYNCRCMTGYRIKYIVYFMIPKTSLHESIENLTRAFHYWLKTQSPVVLQ